MKTRSYAEMLKLKTFDERLKYLMLDGAVGEEVFGFERYLNQQFYRSLSWKTARREAIIRDNGCDLAIDDRPIFGKIYVHHINPITKDDLTSESPLLTDLDNLVTVSFNTHQAITYGTENPIPKPAPVRKQNDTCPWR